MKKTFEIKTIVYSIFFTFFSLIYSIFNIVLSAINRSRWNLILGFFYLILSLTKCTLLFIFFKERKNKTVRNKHFCFGYFINSIIIVVLTMSISSLNFLVYRNDRLFQYDFVYVLINGVYAGLKLILAIINIIKARKSDNNLVKALRSNNFVSAMTSLLIFSSTILNTYFYQHDVLLINMILGFIFCGIVFIFAIFMLIDSLKEIKMLKSGKSDSYGIDVEDETIIF